MATSVFSMQHVQPGLTLGQSLTSLTALAEAIVAYMNRTDLGPIIPSFVGIAEGRIALDLRTWQMVKGMRLTQTEGEYQIALPDDWLEWQLLAIGGKTLEYLPLAEFYALGGQNGGFYSMSGQSLLVTDGAIPAGQPDIVVDGGYYARIPALNDTDPAPWLLLQYPQVYLYASLVSACEYVKDEQRAQMWAGQYSAVVTQLNSQSYKAAVSGSVLRQRGPRG